MSITKYADSTGLTEFWAKVKSHVTSAISGKQDTLVSGTNIKTVNNNSLLGSGDISISSGSQNVWYGLCNDSADTGNRRATTDNGNFEFELGNIAIIKMATYYDIDIGSPTLKIDNASAMPIYRINTNGNYEQLSYRAWGNQEVLYLVCDQINYNNQSIYAFVILNQQHASSYAYGITKLSSSTSSTSITEAATPSAVKAAYDRAETKAHVNTATITLPTTGWTADVGDVFWYGVPWSSFSSQMSEPYGENWIASPDPDYIDIYSKCGVYCGGYSGGSLWFAVKTEPTSSIKVNIMLI